MLKNCFCQKFLILSNKKFNENNLDIICGAITSSAKYIHQGVKITNFDLESGNLKVESTIKPGKIYSIQQNRIIRNIGKLKKNKVKEVIKNLNLNIEIDE